MKPILTDGKERRWSLYVGGMEVTDYLMDFKRAERLADDYIDDKYDNVVAYQYDTGEEVRFV